MRASAARPSGLHNPLCSALEQVQRTLHTIRPSYLCGWVSDFAGEDKVNESCFFFFLIVASDGNESLRRTPHNSIVRRKAEIGCKVAASFCFVFSGTWRDRE